jgi:tetratricopeptide (TPR) repeat protein
MATKRRGAAGPVVGTVETEIERSREEGNWKRVIELAEQLKHRPEKTFETLAQFLIGEAKLEDFLEEYPPKEKNTSRAKDGLQEARECLMKTIGDDAKKLGVHLDSYILLGKLNYAMGNYSDALRFYERAQLDALEEKQLPARSLKIMAEAFAIKALCYEKVSANKSKAKIAEREMTIVRCYEISGDLTMLFLQV